MADNPAKAIYVSWSPPINPTTHPCHCFWKPFIRIGTAHDLVQAIVSSCSIVLSSRIFCIFSQPLHVNDVPNIRTTSLPLYALLSHASPYSSISCSPYLGILLLGLSNTQVSLFIMGVTESKLLLEKLSTACSDADKHGRNEIQGVFSDKEVRPWFADTLMHALNTEQFVDCLTRLWRHLPEYSKNQINTSTRRRCRKVPKRWKDQKITLSEDLRKSLAQWTTNHCTLFDEIEIPVFPGLSPCYPIATSYKLLLEVESRKNRDTIRARFLKVLFFYLKDRFCVTNVQANAVDWISQAIRAAGLEDSNSDVISSNIRNWIKVGARYDSLCRDLGNYNVEDYRYLGVLFRLPDDVTDRLWVWEIHPSTAANQSSVCWKKFQWVEKTGARQSNL